MPPPLDPVLQTMPERKSIQMGANTGHVVKPAGPTVAHPVVVASDTTLKAA